MSKSDGNMFDHNVFESARDRQERAMFAPIEALVRASGGYVRPSDDLRPSTLEAARDSCSKRRWSYRLAGVAAAVMVLAVCNVPGRFSSPISESAVAPTMVKHEFEIRHQAAKGLGFNFSPAWAWYEAFLEVRKQQDRRVNE